MTDTKRPAVQRLQEYVKADPDNWGLRAELFDAALAAGATEVARGEVERALAAKPDDAAWRHRLATLALATRRYAEAQGALEALIAQGHADPAVQHNLAYALFSQGRLEEAITRLGPLLAGRDETSDMAWVLWLRCHHRVARQGEALAAFVTASSQRPMPPDAWGVASLMAFDDERLEEARAWSERALQGRRDQLEALATRGSLALGAQDVAGAVGAFDTALRLNPSDGRSWSGLAFARMLKLDLTGALDAFAKAIATMPGHVGTWIGYAWCQLLSNQPQAALGSIEKALELDRNVAETHGALAVVLARLGQADRAREEVEVALRLDPKNLSVRYAQAVLGGETADPSAFLRFARRVLSKVPAGRDADRKLADVVFKDRR